VTSADGSTLSVVRVGVVRFQMWDGMIRMVIDVRYVPGVQRSLVSLSELDSREYELRIHGGSMDRGDMVVIQGTRHGGLYEMVGTMESASTIISASTPTRRVVGGDDMIGCGGAARVETCHMAVSAIAQLPGQRIAGGGRLDPLKFRGRLGTSACRRGHAVMLHGVLDLCGHGP
jgi:hypothetical protein